MNNFQDKITETLLNAPSGVHSIFYGFKIKDNELTDTKSLIYCVTEKKPLSALSSNETIPKQIVLDDKQYSTDVVQHGKFKLSQCYALNDPAVLSLRSRVRPLSGGIEISSLHTWTQVSPYQFSLGIGTLGFLAKDNTDNKLVGVTNSHVIIEDSFLSTEKDSLSAASSIIDNIVFSDPQGYNALITPRVLQFGTSTGTVNFTEDKIGVPKRYVSTSSVSANRVDGALLTIHSLPQPEAYTNTQAITGLNTLNMPFATDSEINALPFNNTLYSVGARTGPKGTNCPLICLGIGSAYIDANRQGVEVQVLYADCIGYRFIDSSNLPIYSGDSGSALIANINGQNKIVGLVFAGDTNTDPNNPTSTVGIASKITHVANELNISAWDGSYIDISPYNPTYSYILRPLSDARTSIVSGGKTFYLAGTVRTTESPSL